jgi:hypothetical protein
MEIIMQDREMTLIEWLAKLPESHLANKEFKELKTELDASYKTRYIVRDTLEKTEEKLKIATDALDQIRINCLFYAKDTATEALEKINGNKGTK